MCSVTQLLTVSHTSTAHPVALGAFVVQALDSRNHPPESQIELIDILADRRRVHLFHLRWGARAVFPSVQYRHWRTTSVVLSRWQSWLVSLRLVCQTSTPPPTHTHTHTHHTHTHTHLSHSRSLTITHACSALTHTRLSLVTALTGTGLCIIHSHSCSLDRVLSHRNCSLKKFDGERTVLNADTSSLALALQRSYQSQGRSYGCINSLASSLDCALDLSFLLHHGTCAAWFVIYYVVLIRFKFFRELFGLEENIKKKRRKTT